MGLNCVFFSISNHPLVLLRYHHHPLISSPPPLPPPSPPLPPPPPPPPHPPSPTPQPPTNTWSLRPQPPGGASPQDAGKRRSRRQKIDNFLAPCQRAKFSRAAPPLTTFPCIVRKVGAPANQIAATAILQTHYAELC